MQVSKFVLAICATTVCAGFLCVHAEDTPAQAAARAALMQSMGEPAAVAPAAPAAQPPPAPKAPVSTNAPPAPSAPAAPVAPATPMTPAAAAPVVQAPAMAPLDSEAQAAARAALLQAMGQPPAAAPASVAAPAPAAGATAPVAVVPATPEIKPVAATPAKASTASKFGSEAGFMPIVAPPLPISAAKEQQLDALLVHYKADQISPEEYHKQRAAILADP